MPKKREAGFPILKIPKNATKKQIYAIVRKEFTAADLQKFTETGPMVPMEKTIAAMKAIHKEETRKRRKKS
jgi:hypothetical protein